MEDGSKEAASGCAEQGLLCIWPWGSRARIRSSSCVQVSGNYSHSLPPPAPVPTGTRGTVLPLVVPGLLATRMSSEAAGAGTVAGGGLEFAKPPSLSEALVQLGTKGLVRPPDMTKVLVPCHHQHGP